MMTSSQIIRKAMKYLRGHKFICCAIDAVHAYSIRSNHIKRIFAVGWKGITH